ncbi:hypothetical protein [Streptomyces abikoensis]|uniref:hypothetical protein n=1 Tax=Streptomyces abikoensis TaxID=97398 RepID=UPI0019A8050F|nr:hypothetical protein [Streptomyces abikoensis]GGP77009.1 hypothetical protein GCM10010214_60560 [Streptomyces abikoensis]
MADANISPPMASPGYGKRSAPGQAPRDPHTFAHLPAREAYIASHIDRLPDGAAMDAKTLAKELPYGQQAVRTALNNLSEAGHLRRIREPAGDGTTQWVFRTFFSRTARSDAWWERWLNEGDEPQPETKPQRSPAYDALATLGLADPRLALSARECADLEPLAAEWLARGIPPAQLVAALTAGLPASVHSPAAFTRTRLREKMPPEPPSVPQALGRRIMECTSCRTPGRPEALSGGLCRVCRGVDVPDAGVSAQHEVVVRAHVARIRAGIKRGGRA